MHEKSGSPFLNANFFPQPFFYRQGEVRIYCRDCFVAEFILSVAEGLLTMAGTNIEFIVGEPSVSNPDRYHRDKHGIKDAKVKRGGVKGA